jgi:hypothetical protein
MNAGEGIWDLLRPDDEGYEYIGEPANSEKAMSGSTPIKFTKALPATTSTYPGRL